MHIFISNWKSNPTKKYRTGRIMSTGEHSRDKKRGIHRKKEITLKRTAWNFSKFSTDG